MSKTSVEFELLAPSREKPGGQQQQSRPTRWPFPVRHYDQEKCEMQYRAFRDAYDKLESDGEGNPYVNRLTDAELRVRWLHSYYTEFGNPSQEKIASWAHDVSRGKHGPSLNDSQRQLLALVALVLIIALLSL